MCYLVISKVVVFFFKLKDKLPFLLRLAKEWDEEQKCLPNTGNHLIWWSKGAHLYL